jgi:hypothetical protein
MEEDEFNDENSDSDEESASGTRRKRSSNAYSRKCAICDRTDLVGAKFVKLRVEDEYLIDALNSQQKLVEVFAGDEICELHFAPKPDSVKRCVSYSDRLLRC